MDTLHFHNLYGHWMLDVHIIKPVCVITNIHSCNFQQILH
jgi:hypothetical protein